MQRDIRSTELYRKAERIYTAVRQPGSGQICDAAELNVSPDGKVVMFSGTLVQGPEAMSTTRICRTDLASGDTRVLTSGPNNDRSPKYSPDGRQVAFLSDRHQAGDFQLYVLDAANGEVRKAASVDGWVEYFHWSPDGRRILLGVAGHGADRASGQGAVTTQQREKDVPSWMPKVRAGAESFMWRRLWVYELARGRVGQVSAADINIWEAAWCSDRAVAVVASDGPGEGDWFEATVRILDLENNTALTIYSPAAQVGLPAVSPSGRYLSVVESICSDRGLIAGNLKLISLSDGAVAEVDSLAIDVSHAEWRSEECLLLAGHRGFETIVATYEPRAAVCREVWSSVEVSTGGFHATVAGIGTKGECAALCESFDRSPHLAVIARGKRSIVKSFDVGYEALAKTIHSVERVEWRASDGIAIQGWCLRPQQPAPHPVIMYVHGGPVWSIRPFFLGRRAAHILMFVSHGYAVFFPNPRGSTGRGQEFVRAVLGDMGGKDAQDCLSGLDHLVSQGIADPRRLGVTGASYGGFMSAWLITQDARFSAAVPVAAITNHVTQRLVSNIPHFSKLFLADSLANASGEYLERSPVFHAHKVRTPTMNICGALDRCTPPEEAIQFHNALMENGAVSVLVTYPEEGHGVREFPAAIDFAARVVAWFEHHMSASGAVDRGGRDS